MTIIRRSAARQEPPSTTLGTNADEVLGPSPSGRKQIDVSRQAYRTIWRRRSSRRFGFVRRKLRWKRSFIPSSQPQAP
jgi:hypothetical protein